MKRVVFSLLFVGLLAFLRMALAPVPTAQAETFRFAAVNGSKTVSVLRNAFPAPTVVTDDATGITSSGATLNGTVNANDGSTTVTFEYGTTTSYGTSVTATQSPVTGNTNTPVSQAITNLSPNTTYHFRVAGTNASGTTNGSDRTFTTAAACESGPPATFINKTTANGLGASFVWGSYADASTVYAATSGGLGISTNGGSTFINRTTANGLGTNQVNRVYTSGSTIYVATNSGLSISTDGGSSFINKTTANGLGGNQVLDVSAVGNTVYAGTVGGGLSVSPDGGSSFSNKTTANGLGSNTVMSLYVDGSKVYAGTTGGLSISTDGGSTFTNKTTANGLGSNAVWGVYASGSTVYAATYGGLSISTDGGSNFTNKTTTNGLGSNQVYGVYAIGNTVYAATNGGGLGISTDGGSTFTIKNVADGLGYYNVNYVYVNGSMVYAATDGGLSLGACSAPPAAATNAATALTSSGATLHGTVNAINASTTVTFEYGTTTSYGTSVTATQSPVTGNTDTPVSKAITGLTPNTTYHFRVVGKNASGKTNGDDLTFTTDAVAPSVLTQDATTGTSTGATLNGEVNPLNATATITFEYGTDTSYGTPVNAVPPSASGTTSTTVSADLSSLTPNTTYHFRVVAENAGGLTNGGDKSFTTSCLSSAITVTSPSDTGAGSLRQAINDVCAGGTITFDNDYTILLDSELAIAKDLTIDGEKNTITVDGQNRTRVFNVTAGNVTFDTLTVANGSVGAVTSGGGIDNSGTLTVTNSTFRGNSADYGAAIANYATLTVTDSTFSGNVAEGFGGGIYNYYGLLTVTNSTFSGNSSSWGLGGGIFNMGPLTVTNSTLVGNSAYREGGGICNYNSLTLINSTLSGNLATTGGGIYSWGTLNVINSTLVGNSAPFDAGGRPNRTHSTLRGNSPNGYGGGIVSDGTAHLKNSIVANSIVGGDCLYANAFTADAYNIDSDGSCDNATTMTTDEMALGTLADNGGPTQTMALGSNSAAIDAGDQGVCTNTNTVNNLDQRGEPRADLRCDIGAFELQYGTSAPNSNTVTVQYSANGTGKSFGPALAIITPTTGAPIAFTVTMTPTAYINPAPPANALPIQWDATASGTPFSLLVTLCYLPPPNPTGLHVYHYNGSKWIDLGGVVDTTTYKPYACVTATTSLRSLSPLALVFEPTAADVTGVKASVNKKGQAVVQWQTLSEARISGFNIYRKTGKGEWKQINANVRQAKYAGQPSGRKYRYTDKTVKAGRTYRYKVEILYLDGHREFTEIVRVKVK